MPNYKMQIVFKEPVFIEVFEHDEKEALVEANRRIQEYSVGTLIDNDKLVADASSIKETPSKGKWL